MGMPIGLGGVNGRFLDPRLGDERFYSQGVREVAHQVKRPSNLEGTADPF
jgi:hypothetical protein